MLRLRKRSALEKTSEEWLERAEDAAQRLLDAAPEADEFGNRVGSAVGNAVGTAEVASDLAVQKAHDAAEKVSDGIGAAKRFVKRIVWRSAWQMTSFTATAATAKANLEGNDKTAKFTKLAIVPTAWISNPKLVTLPSAALHTAGDWILEGGEGHAERGSDRLVRGATAFGAGHLLLSAYYLSKGAKPCPLFLIPGLFVASASAGVLTTIADEADRPAALYPFVLLATASLGAGWDAPGQFSRRIGGALFALSDVLLLVRRQVGGSLSKTPAQALDAAVIATYGAGQNLIYSSL